MENANTLLYSQTRQQVVRQDWRERKPAGAGVGSPPCLSGGGQRMGIWKKRRRKLLEVE